MIHSFINILIFVANSDQMKFNKMIIGKALNMVPWHAYNLILRSYNLQKKKKWIRYSNCKLYVERIAGCTQMRCRSEFYLLTIFLWWLCLYIVLVISNQLNWFSKKFSRIYGRIKLGHDDFFMESSSSFG